MLEWNEVDPQEFEKYPPLKPVRGHDDLDDVLDAIQAGKTVELTLADEGKLRGRRMALARRAKQRGVKIEMRYQDTRIIVRQSTRQQDDGAAPVAGGTGKQRPRGRRSGARDTPEPAN